MNLEQYSFTKATESYYYEFYSEGPNGRIKKVVEFYMIYPRIFNIAFGDWDAEDLCLNDTSISNNNDRNKILATVAGIVIDFINNHPEIILFAEGSTNARTRLYQMGISKFWKEISQRFEIDGLMGGKWENFQKGKNYDAFLLKLKS